MKTILIPHALNYSKVKNYITNWLIEYANKADCKGFVIGVSGGIDSAVVSTLCAMTGNPLLVLEMPIHQKKAEVNRATDHINWLRKNFKNVSSRTVDLTKTYDVFSNAIGTRDVFIGGVEEISTEKEREFSLSNSRSRLRMTTLYQFAGMHKLLVAGTGNKVEDFGIGFFSKYGDGGVDISPLADLMKSEVYSLGRELGIIESILTAAPTDGLHDDERTDEEQLKCSYDELEWAMNWVEYHTKESGDNVWVKSYSDYEDHLLTNRQLEVLDIYQIRNSSNQHKMNPIPICKVSHLKT